MNEGFARSLKGKDSLHALLKHIGEACSEADALGTTPVTASGLSLRMASSHCK